MTRVAVAGLGLIGGSLALALGARGYDGNPSVRQAARRRGIDVADSLPDAVAGAEVVVAAVPTGATIPLLVEIARRAPAAALTDTASLKRPIVEAAPGLPAGARFVGGHPMAGSQRAASRPPPRTSSAAARGSSARPRAPTTPRSRRSRSSSGPPEAVPFISTGSATTG